jgi:uncharacterized membrane protein
MSGGRGEGLWPWLRPVFGLALVHGAALALAMLLVLGSHAGAALDFVLRNRLPPDLEPPFFWTLAACDVLLLAAWLLAGRRIARVRGVEPGAGRWLCALGLAPLLLLIPAVLAGASWQAAETLSGLQQAAIAAALAAAAGLMSPAHAPHPARLALRRAGWIGAVALAAGFALVFSIQTCRRHWMFLTNALDLGVFTSILWNTLQGDWFWNPIDRCNHLGQHFSPILLVPAALFRLHAAPETLLVLQAVSFAGTGLLVYALALRLSGRPLAALCLSAAALAHPSVHRAIFFDFHELALGAPLAVGALLALDSGRTRLGLGLLGLLLLVKEDMTLVGVALGLWLAFVQRRRGLGLGLAAACAALGVALVGAVMPAIKGSDYMYASRFGDGTGFSGLLWALLTNPIYAARVLYSPVKAATVLGLLLPFAFLPLASASAVLLLVWAEFLLSNHPNVMALEAQYGSVVLPVTACAAGYGLARLQRARPRLALALAVFAAAFSLQDAARRLPSRFVDGRLGPRQQIAHRLLARIEARVPVSADNAYAAHLALRRQISPFPWGGDEARAAYVLLDAREGRPYPDGLNWTRNAARFVLGGSHRLIEARDGLFLFRRGPPQGDELAALAEELSRQWHEREGLARRRAAYLAPQLLEALDPAGLERLLAGLRRRGWRRVLLEKGLPLQPGGLRPKRIRKPQLARALRDVPPDSFVVLASAGHVADAAAAAESLQRASGAGPDWPRYADACFALLLYRAKDGSRVLLERVSRTRDVSFDLPAGRDLGSGLAAPCRIIVASRAEPGPACSIQAGGAELDGRTPGLCLAVLDRSGRLVRSGRFDGFGRRTLELDELALDPEAERGL